MRIALLSAALVLACSSEKPEPKPTETPASSAAVKPTSHPPSQSKLGRGQVPEVFAEGDTPGRVLAISSHSLYWVERRAEGSFVIASNLASGERRDLAGPLAPVRSLAATDQAIYIAAAPLPGKKSSGPAGVFSLSWSGSDQRDEAELKKLADEPGLLATDGKGVYSLQRGTSANPGRIWRLGSGEPAIIARPAGALGRAALTADGGRVFWLRDERVPQNGVKVRVGTIETITEGASTVVPVAKDIASPGSELERYQGFLYFTAKDSSGKRRLYRVSESGGDPEPLLDDAWEVVRFAVDASGIYVYARWRQWKLIRVDHGSGALRALATPEVRMTSALFTDAQHVYWGQSGAILRAKKDAK